MKIVLVILAFLFFLSSCKKEDTQPNPPTTPVTITPPPSFGFYVVGYFPSYRNVAEIPDVQFKRCNVVNYAFFGVNSSGLLTVNAPDVLAALTAKARANDAKVFVSINGTDNFKNMAATENGRNNFIKDVMKKARQYGFDGVDIDWEFPRTDDGTDITFTALMKELSDSLHRDAKYYLTTAITAGKYAGAVRDAIHTELFAYVDWFNIMSYDDFSSTVPYRNHSTLSLAETSLNYWIDVRKMPPAKAVLGIPAYGRPSGITQSGTIQTYAGILANGGNALSDSAVVSEGTFMNYTIYYNGQPTVKKKAIMAKQRANGIMLWELAQDSPDQRSLLKAACDTVGIIF